MVRSGSAEGLNGLKRFLAKLEMFIGFLSLGLATFLLQLETRRRGNTEGAEQALALLSAMTAGALALAVSGGVDENIVPSGSESIRRFAFTG